MPYMLVLGATQCSVEVPGTFSNICEQKMDAEIGEILVRTAFAVPANTYMHCSWNVVANNDKSIAVATDNTNNLYVSAMNEEQFAAFTAGSCTWDSSALDWVGGSCAGSTNYGGKAKTGATHIEANWFSVTESPLHTVMYNPSASAVSITLMHYHTTSSGLSTAAIVIISVISALATLFVGYLVYKDHTAGRRQGPRRQKWHQFACCLCDRYRNVKNFPTGIADAPTGAALSSNLEQQELVPTASNQSSAAQDPDP